MLLLKFVPDWFDAGGPVMWVILMGSLLTVTVLFVKLWTLRSSSITQPDLVRDVQDLAHAGRIEAAIKSCGENPGPYADIALAALQAVPYGRDEVLLAVRAAGRQLGGRMSTFLPVVKTVASTCPLLGLFGTVLGMIEVFAQIANSNLGNFNVLSSGIETALLTTAFGLGVAIPSLIVHEAFTAKVDRLLLSTEREVMTLMTTLLSTDAGRRAAGDFASAEQDEA